MVNTPLNPLLREIRQLARLQGAADKTDRDLLAEFLARRDESAFAT